MDHLLLRAPSANRVYADESAALSAAELEITAPFASAVKTETLAGVDYLSFESPPLAGDQLLALARQSSALALFGRESGLLRPIELPAPWVLSDDLVTIPKYPGKTNEQFTRALLNVTLASVRRPIDGPRQVLDPLSGRGTTLTTNWLSGGDSFGVEVDEKAFEAMAAFLKTWLRRKRIKHKADITPVRRDGRSIGRRFDAEITTEAGRQAMTVFTGDTRESARLFGKKKFDAIVTDAPYGVVHGSNSDVRGTFGKRDRSPAGLLQAAVPVWVSQLKRGGAIGVSWNTHGMPREALAELLAEQGLEVATGEAWSRFDHRVDSSIKRDLLVGVLPS